MASKIKDEKLCDGVHIMAIGAEKNVPVILEKAGLPVPAGVKEIQSSAFNECKKLKREGVYLPVWGEKITLKR